MDGQEQVIQGLQAVYMPFWVFDGFVEVRRPVAGRPDPASRLGASMLGRELMMFDNLVFSAMDLPPPWLLKKVLPYELGALVPYEPRLLANWPAVLYHRDVEVAVNDAYNVMLSSAVWRKRSVVVAQASDLALLRRSFQVTTVTYQLVLLPVWAALAQREQEQRLVLVNGQTGEVAFSSSLRAKRAR